MVASCYRRSGDYTAALEKYKWVHQHFPDDTDCKNVDVIAHCLVASRLILQEHLRSAYDVPLFLSRAPGDAVNIAYPA